MAIDQDDNWNDELENEVSIEGVESLVVYSRDWTVETILRQIELDNIDLNPGFQRRNAWNDSKRSKLIESLIIGVPVPEIVLAEDSTKRKKFIVIDGKQRLLALAGFQNPAKYNSWDRAKLRGLNTRQDLNSNSFLEIEEKNDEYRQLMNADIRCTVISNYKSNGVLYDIFYRLNTGSVPLSSQELRQVLNRGPFADFLITSTNVLLPLHDILNLNGPDNRLRDAEIILRYISFSVFGKEYRGNLSQFLDDCMARINKDWDNFKPQIQSLFDQFNSATNTLIQIFDKKVGRKFSKGTWENRFNRALFEVEVYYFGMIQPHLLAQINKQDVLTKFEVFCNSSTDFLDSIETSTKNLDRYRNRYQLFQEFVNGTFNVTIDQVPLPAA